MKLYSEKAFDIIKAYKKRLRYSDGVNLHRGADGEIKADSFFMKYAADFFWETTKDYDKVNTIKSRSQDSRQIDLMTGFDESYMIEAKTLSLIAALMRDSYPIAAIRKNWGDEAVDEMVGKPCNPLLAGKRQTIMLEIEKTEKETQRKVYEKSAEYDAIIDEKMKPYIDKLEAIKAQIEKLKQESILTSNAKMAAARALEEERCVKMNALRDEGNAKIAELKAALGSE